MKSNYFFTFLCSLCLFLASNLNAKEKKPLNLLLITVDDMSCDSVGVYGCELEGTTPVMDRLASQSLRFDYAHVTVGNCNPCRNVMFSGLISHNNKVEGFYKVPNPSFRLSFCLSCDTGRHNPKNQIKDEKKKKRIKR